MEGDQSRVLFLLDAAYKIVENCWELNRLYLACIRVLLCLAEFPSKKVVTWNYTFFNSAVPVKKPHHFIELRSELLENFLEDIKCTKTKLKTQGAAFDGKHKPVSALYRALASVVQDFVWDAPELSSPGKHQSMLGPRNLVFILGCCPHTLNDLYEFCGTPYSMHPQSYKEVLQNELIPSDLLLHLQNKGISVFWIDITCLSNVTQHLECTEDCVGLSLVASVMNICAGQLIPIEAVIDGCSIAGDQEHLACLLGCDAENGNKRQHIVSALGYNVAAFSAALNLGAYLFPNISSAGNKASSQLNVVHTSGQTESIRCREPHFGDPFSGILLSLIKQAELPLHWLNPSRIYLSGSNCNLTIMGKLMPDSVSLFDDSAAYALYSEFNFKQTTCRGTIPKLHLCGCLCHVHVAELSIIAVGTAQAEFRTGQSGTEDLFIWLARNQMLLLLSLQCPIIESATSLAILQPLTPSRASLSCIDPSFQAQVLQHLANSYATDSSSFMEFITKSFTRESNSNAVPLGSLFDKRFNLPVNLLRSFCSPSQISSSFGIDTVVFVCAWIYFNLHRQTICCSYAEVHPFFDLNLVSWHIHLPTYGISHNSMKELLSFQKASTAADEQKAPYIRHLNNLQKQQCGSSSVSPTVANSRRNPFGGLPSLRENVLGEEERKESPPNCEGIVFSEFHHRYQEEINSLAETEDLKVWVEREVAVLKTALFKLGFELSDPTIFTKLFDNSVLLTHTQLHQKYASSEQTTIILEKKAIEYQLQVLLQLEVAKLLTSCEDEPIASELIHLLRDLSFMKNPGFMGRYMKEIILPSYSTCCQKLLTIVFDGLMLPLPASLCYPGLPSDDSHVTMISSPLTDPSLSITSQEDSQSSCISKQQLQDDSVSLVRRNSFSGFFHQQRRISITSKRKRPQAKIQATESDSSQRSENGEQERGVKRTLFNRSHTISEFGRDKTEKDRTPRKCKKGSLTFQDIIVKETPRKKQVENYRKFKLQRHRSKTEGPDLSDISVIAESPKRSFYSNKTILSRCGDLYSPEKSMHCSRSDEIVDPASPMQSADLNVDESASMMAFALCTPTKDDPRTFSGLL